MTRDSTPYVHRSPRGFTWVLNPDRVTGFVVVSYSDEEIAADPRAREKAKLRLAAEIQAENEATGAGWRKSLYDKLGAESLGRNTHFRLAVERDPSTTNLANMAKAVKDGT